MAIVVEPPPIGRAVRQWRTRRRLSQLDLALRADTTQRHVSFIEQGRSKPGREVVVRLAQALDLSLRERNTLLLAAGYAPVFAESSLDAPELQVARDALTRILDGHLPFPAVVVQRHGELVAANRAVSILLSGVAPQLRQTPVNVLRLALHPSGMAPRVVNLPEWGRHITESLRDRATRSPDPHLDDLVRELDGYVPPLGGETPHLGFAVPLRLRSPHGELHLMTTLTSFATAVDVTLAELQLEAFVPVDETTARALAEHDRAVESAGLPPSTWQALPSTTTEICC